MADYQSVAPTTLALTLADCKRQLNVTHDADDDLLISQIKAATEMLEARANRCFVAQTRLLKMRTFDDGRYVNGRTIRPPRSPLKSITSISYVSGTGTTTTLPSSDYIVSTGDTPGEITEAHGATWPATYGVQNDVTVTYVAGHSTASSGVPERVKHAVRMVVAHWYRNREAVVISGAVPQELALSVDALMGDEYVEYYG